MSFPAEIRGGHGIRFFQLIGFRDLELGDFIIDCFTLGNEVWVVKINGVMLDISRGIQIVSNDFVDNTHKEFAVLLQSQRSHHHSKLDFQYAELLVFHDFSVPSFSPPSKAKHWGWGAVPPIPPFLNTNCGNKDMQGCWVCTLTRIHKKPS